MEFLKTILGDELYAQVETAVNAYNSTKEHKANPLKLADLSTGEYVGKGKYDSLSTEKNSLSEQLKTAQGTIAELQKSEKDNTELQEKINIMKTQMEQIRTQAEATAKSYSLKESLAKAGVSDPDYLIFKAGGVEKFQFDKDGNPLNLDIIIQPFRSDKGTSFLFEQNQHRQDYQPQGGSGTPGKNPFAKDSFNLTEQGKLLRENPEQARALAAAVGTKI